MQVKVLGETVDITPEVERRRRRLRRLGKCLMCELPIDGKELQFRGVHAACYRELKRAAKGDPDLEARKVAEGRILERNSALVYHEDDSRAMRCLEAIQQ